MRIMKANYVNNDKDLRIIRPLVYCRENQTREYATESGLPVIPDSCPACFSKPTQREQMKQLPALQEKDNPHLFANLLHAMRPTMDEAPNEGWKATTETS
jgi:tRNA(Ile)-lysidine synthase TilS/MesJ